MPVTRGIIFLWSGTPANIPTTWHLCDGTHGTPDLRDKFVIGAGLTYARNDTGGSVSHNHPFTAAPHAHFLPLGAALKAGTGYTSASSSYNETGTTDSKNHLPPYYALCYIMKL